MLRPLFRLVGVLAAMFALGYGFVRSRTPAPEPSEPPVAFSPAPVPTAPPATDATILSAIRDQRSPRWATRCCSAANTSGTTRAG